MKDLERKNDILLDIMEQLVLVMRASRKEIEAGRQLFKDSLLHNTLYCKFVEERLGVDVREISADFDEWVDQFSEEELQQFAEEGIAEELTEPSEKNDAEVPEALYTIDEIMSALEPPEEGHNG